MDFAFLLHVKKSFNKTEVLKDISIEIAKGEIFGIIGQSGAGKSTLLRCINGLEEIQDGKVNIEGKTGMVFQSYDLFPHMTVIQNLMLAPLKVQKRKKDEVRAEAEQLLERVGLSSKKNNYPRQLSGGEQQRVALARALVNKPEIILADEPTGNLDPKHSWDVMNLLDEINSKGTTVVVVTHNKEIVNVMKKRVITLKKGVIVSDVQKGGYIDED